MPTSDFPIHAYTLQSLHAHFQAFFPKSSIGISFQAVGGGIEVAVHPHCRESYAEIGRAHV